MANITTTRQRGHGGLRRTLWFIALWAGGVGGAMLLALPFKLLIQAGAAIH
ncbi:hypothetical protein BGLT_04071 [Caballeronia glathei]|jgi:hypothetical protein|uniref:hypothetical protein n=1 Tax=Caballeronia glathei TaxID=60547 RepID=UPI000506239B|nr:MULTISPECIES: hypothetical protein [Burkholderiaceae]CDY75174.1 hypothetical protein BGLT_04071 [Caballeronia glathei]